MESTSEELRPGLRPPRFSLAGLFACVAIFGVLFATHVYVGLYAALILLFLFVAITTHVAGNALGTQLRDNIDIRTVKRRQKQNVEVSDFAPPSQLHHRSALGKPILLTTLFGTIAAAAVGGYGLSTLMARPTIGTVLFGAIACSVLGGIWTFAACSFLQVASGAMRQATRDAKK